MGNDVEQEFGIQIYPIWFEDPSAYVTQRPPAPLEYIRGVINKAVRPTDQNPAHYINAVRIELKRILRSRAGRALAHSLRLHSNKRKGKDRGKAVLIMPIEYDECVAEEIRHDQQAWVGFSPATLRKTCHIYRPASLPHEKLYHELFHALREISGHLHRHAVNGRLSSWGNTEEFLAVLMTDIFVSDRTNHHKTSLRGTYVGHASLDPEFADSFRFFRLGLQAFSTIATFCRENHGFSQMLANVPAPFNPIAAYYKNPQKAYEMAVNGLADASLEDLGPEMDFYIGPMGTWVKTNPTRGLPQSGGR